MTFLLFLFGIFLALGMFLLMADLLRLPRLATQRAMLSVGRQEKKQARSVEALLMGWAIKLAPHIHMDEYIKPALMTVLSYSALERLLSRVSLISCWSLCMTGWDAISTKPHSSQSGLPRRASMFGASMRERS